MNSAKQIERIFDLYSDAERHKFFSIPEADRPHVCNLVCAIIYMTNKFTKRNNDYPIIEHAEDDILYFEKPLNDEWPLNIDDIVYLLRCGVSWDRDEKRITFPVATGSVFLLN